MNFISIAEPAEKLGNTCRREQALCAQGRIPGLSKFGKAWTTPKNAEESIARRKNKVSYQFAEVDAGDK